MEVTLSHISKTFIHQEVIKDLSFSFQSGGRYAIVGMNGSGKSTLIQLIAGFSIPGSGSLRFLWKNKEIQPEEIYRYVAVAAPYMELIEELTLVELFHFHQQFKPFLPGISIQTLVKKSGLEKNAGKPIRHYSSGMKQRVRLSLAICSDTPLLLLDEPCSNFDQAATAWYQDLLQEFAGQRTVIVASNEQEAELFLCREKIYLH